MLVSSSTRIVASLLFLSCCCSVLTKVYARNDELFNYASTNTRNRDYGPSDWNNVDCSDKDKCVGWPDTWELGIDWEPIKNTCRWCPAGNSRCGRHHQSPIDLKRNRAIETSPDYNECIDVHWMKYEDGTCTWDQLLQNDAFDINRHALTIRQPIEKIPPSGNDKNDIGYRLQCNIWGKGRIWSRIDFSKGFSHWWFLSHTDIKVPSEHTQEGKRYSAEIQLHHFYSFASGKLDDENEINGNEMGTVAIFLDASEDYPVYEYLDKYICQFRKKEHTIRQDCGMEPIDTPYPGCYEDYHFASAAPSFGTPTDEADPSSGASSTADEVDPTTDPPIIEQQDIIISQITKRKDDETLDISDDTSNRKRRYLKENNMEQLQQIGSNNKNRIVMSPKDFRPPERTEEEWEEWIQGISNGTINTTTTDRNLLERWNHLFFNNYQWLIDVRTEYYYRYSGTQTIPPCYGNFISDSRTSTNHWRVLKDPIRIHTRQLVELERLIKDRIDPKTCINDTAAKIDTTTGRVSVARPIQEFHKVHYKVFCECKDWPSKWPEDRAWCALRARTGKNYRFYDHPYNYKTDGF